MRLCRRCGRLHDDGTELCPRDGATLEDYRPTLAAGQKVAADFSIVAALGVGLSGEVYEGREEAQGERVIVRLLSEDVAKDRRLSDVVRRHLLKQQDFQHKYIVRTRVVDQHENRILFVRDWVEGTRLEDLLAAEGALGVQRTLGLAVRICTTLAEAHKAGLLHLQLRASNVFVVPNETADGESIRLVDFGVGPRRKVGPRPYYGDPSTLSPEQVEGKIVSFKSDMFAAGLLLYRMLAGTPAFSGSDDVVVKQICEAPVPPIKYRPTDPIPMELWTFVRQALEKKPIHRPIGMAQMADRLKELAGDAAAGRLSLEPPAPAEGGAAGTAAVPPVRILTPGLERAAIGRIALRKQSPSAVTPPTADASDGIDVDVAIDEPPEAPIPGSPDVAAPPSTSAPGTASEAEPAGEAAEAVGEAKATGEAADAAGEAKAAGEVAEAAGEAEPSAKPSAASREDAPPAEAKKPAALPAGTPKSGAKAPPKSPPKSPKSEAAAATVKAAAGAGIEPSSNTVPMEPEILEEVAIPPPMRAGQVPARGAAAGTAALLAATFRRGLFYGLGVGLAVAVIVFFLARFMGRADRVTPPAPPCEPERVAAAAEAGPADPRLTAEGPMHVSAVVDAGAPDAAAADAGAAAPEDVPAVPATEAGETAGVDAGTSPADAAPTPADRAAPVEARTVPGGDAGRAVEVAADTARPATRASVSAEDLARANELVSEGDRKLAARDFGGARSAYEEALQLHPQNNRAKIGLGRTAFQQGNFEDAVRYLEPIYRNQGNMDLGMAYVRVGRLGDAKRQFEKLLARNPDNNDAQRALEAVQRQLGE